MSLIYKGFLNSVSQFSPLFITFYHLFWRTNGEGFGEHFVNWLNEYQCIYEGLKRQQKAMVLFGMGQIDRTTKSYRNLYWIKPKNQVEKNHNKEALSILETKRSQMVLDRQSINSSYIPQHKLKANFLDYYSDYIKENRKAGNRHLETSLTAFKAFIKKDFIAPVDITENLCERFRDYLLKKYNGETPANYFMRFKRVLKAARKDGYFRNNPAEDVIANLTRINR